MTTYVIRVLGPTQRHRISVFWRGITAIAALLCQALFIFISQASTAETRAILIGVSQFDHLKITPLEGPKNDVMLMAATLQARGVPDKNVIRLVDSEAQHYQPTRTNILRVLAETAKTSRRNDLIIVYFSGHGAQVPQPKPVPKGRWIEPDGLDEVFLTRDTKLWDKRKQRVEGALLDDDIGVALAALTKRGVHVWAIFDTCHAGDMIRSTTVSDGAPVLRGINATILGVPLAMVSATAIDSPPPRTIRSSAMNSLVRQQVSMSKPLNGKLVAFYATQPDEAAPEELFPYPDSFIDLPSRTVNGRFGIFTWELANAMRQSYGSYAELAKAITAKYEARPFPTPLFEGDLASSLVPDFRLLSKGSQVMQ